MSLDSLEHYYGRTNEDDEMDELVDELDRMIDEDLDEDDDGYGRELEEE